MGCCCVRGGAWCHGVRGGCCRSGLGWGCCGYAICYGYRTVCLYGLVGIDSFEQVIINGTFYDVRIVEFIITAGKTQTFRRDESGNAHETGMFLFATVEVKAGVVEFSGCVPFDMNMIAGRYSRETGQGDYCQRTSGEKQGQQ